MEQFPLFASGADYSVWDEFEALEKDREKEWALTLARLCEVMTLGADEENFDAWSPPDLFMCRFGSMMTIYTVKPAENVGVDVLVLVCAPINDGASAHPLELAAKRRLADADYWRKM